jgi:hypothetical protein
MFFSENGSIKAEKVALPFQIIKIIMHVHMFLDVGGEKSGIDDVLDRAGRDTLVTCVKDFDHAFYAGDI